MAKTRSLKKRPRESRLHPNPSMATPSPPTRRRQPQHLATVSAILAVLLVISVFCLLLVSSNTWRAFQQSVSMYTITVVNVFPHDPQAFTQGLLYAGNDSLFESTGIYGKSTVRKVALHTGKLSQPWLPIRAPPPPTVSSGYDIQGCKMPSHPCTHRYLYPAQDSFNKNQILKKLSEE